MSRAWLDMMDGADSEPPVADEFDGLWTLVIFSVPEARRADRHAMRTVLGRHGFAPLGNGVWIGSATHLESIRGELELTAFGRYVDLFHSRYEGSMPLPELAKKCWDLTSLRAAYSTFIGDVRLRLGTVSKPDEQAFTNVVRTSNAWRRLMFRDPRLPPSALPEDWPRAEAQLLRDKLIDRSLADARAYVETLD
jgi:phenylacetic acid degradation operon negative regulatory protein